MLSKAQPLAVLPIKKLLCLPRHLWDPRASSMTASFMRVFVNLIFVIVIACHKGLLVGLQDLFGDMRLSLWTRSFFGSLLSSAFMRFTGLDSGRQLFCIHLMLFG